MSMDIWSMSMSAVSPRVDSFYRCDVIRPCGVSNSVSHTQQSGKTSEYLCRTNTHTTVPMVFNDWLDPKFCMHALQADLICLQ